VVCVCLVP